MIVTKDADFADLAMAWGHPPTILWIRLGNCTTTQIDDLLHASIEAIRGLATDPQIGVLVLGS